MIDPKLLEYIKQSRQAGNTDEAIKQSLMAHGWQEAVVSEALRESSLASTVPVPSSPSAAPVRRFDHKPSLNSPFSVMLAIILAIFLFILSNNVITDIAKATSGDITSKLVIESLVILTFLLLAFGLHFMVGQTSRKYGILSGPYYLVAGWLIVRLLFDVSQYLLDTSSTYGVYFVLVLIILVLTGIIIFAQKYLKR